MFFKHALVYYIRKTCVFLGMGFCINFQNLYSIIFRIFLDEIEQIFVTSSDFLAE